ncbi:Spore coat protein SA [Planctomycetes bacterium Poly30]|uniref:Spore coat protein SA n=1 Tax=Saltatorellus ferox TaxID=2528018 RepID=A0A518ERR2_9BACT|nr:Spore coat protein SA [Planctomycetes bacterium Poly30]
MRILHVLTTLDVGGAEMHVLKQVQGQVARGHEVRVAYLKGQGTLEPDFRAAGASDVRHVPGGPLFPIKLRGLLGWCDLVHSHLLKADALTSAAVLLAGKRKRYLSGKHNDEQVLNRPLVGLVHGMIGRVPARTIVLSDHVGRFIEEKGRVPRTRQSRVYYGLDPAPFEEAARSVDRAAILAEFGFAASDVVFLCVARFARQKAHEVLLAATAEARRTNPSIKLLLVGDDPFGDERERAFAVARDLGLSDAEGRGAAVFAGIRRDVPSLMAAADVFVMASRWEGLGLVFLEAMATSRPVLSTTVSAIPEVVVDGTTGRLVPPDDAAAMAAAMVELAGSAELRSRLGTAGHERVIERFGLDVMVDETLRVYEEVLRRSGHGG